MADKTETEKRSTMAKMFKGLFRRKSTIKEGDSTERLDKKFADKKKSSSKSKSKKSKKNTDEFGVDETSRLTHFQRAKPPGNRRPPAQFKRSQSSSSTPLSTMTTPAPRRQSAADVLDRANSIPKEEDEDKVTGNSHDKELPVSNNVMATNNNKSGEEEVPKLFTPALPKIDKRGKLNLVTTQTPAVDNDKENQRMSTEKIDEKVEPIISVEGNSVDADSTKNSSTSLARSLSNKIDFEQLREKSKNLRLVKSFDASRSTGKAVADGEPVKTSRISDPGRQ